MTDFILMKENQGIFTIILNSNDKSNTIPKGFSNSS
jgi:hypothetical protein